MHNFQYNQLDLFVDKNFYLNDNILRNVIDIGYKVFLDN